MMPAVFAEAAGARAAMPRTATKAANRRREPEFIVVLLPVVLPIAILGLLPIGSSFLKPHAAEYPILTTCVKIFRYRGFSPLIDGGRNGLAAIGSSEHPSSAHLRARSARDGRRADSLPQRPQLRTARAVEQRQLSRHRAGQVQPDRAREPAPGPRRDRALLPAGRSLQRNRPLER